MLKHVRRHCPHDAWMKELHMIALRFALAWLLVGAVLAPTVPSARAQALSPAEALQLGTEAYIYGYPLVSIEITRRVVTNVEKPEGIHAPMGQLIKLRQY